MLDKVIQEIYGVGMVLRYKLQSCFSASSPDGKLEAEEVERN